MPQMLYTDVFSVNMLKHVERNYFWMPVIILYLKSKQIEGLYQEQEQDILKWMKENMFVYLISSEQTK